MGADVGGMEESFMINRYLRLAFEGAIYGLLAGILLWASLYLIYETQLSHYRSRPIAGVAISYYGFPLNFSPFCILLLLLALLSRPVIGFIVSKDDDTFTGWLLTGLVMIIATNLIISAGPVDMFSSSIGYGQFCCLYNASVYLTWLLTTVLVAAYTVLFLFVKKFLNERIA
jgi:hypothetical protein